MSLTIGKHTVTWPLIQGGMGVRVSGAGLAGAVARSGGVGLIACAGIGINSPHYNGRNYFSAEPLAIKDELAKARALAPLGIIGVNVMVATTNYEDNVRAACEGGAQVIVCGAGLPMNLPGLTTDWPDVALIPIASSLKAAELVARKWKKAYDRLPDAVVVEDPDTAGGHLGEKLENIGNGTYDQYETVRQIKQHFVDVYNTVVPVIAAGGIWDRADVEYALAQGADGVQMASRFVCTVECDAADAFKQMYLDARPEDIGLIMSPAGLPGRAILSNIEGVRSRDRDLGIRCPSNCLKKCTYKESGERFCIVHSLDRAQRGDVETGIVFCGTNAWKADHIETVADVFEELFGAESAAKSAVSA
jgi:NAD(P)H-dependent flavin oxidoreductase YrpB (nitropropane dioxygenase family)